MTRADLIRNQIFTIENILSPAECAEYIELTENIGYAPAPITTVRGFQMRPDIRNNERVILDDLERAANLWQRVSAYIPEKIGRWRAIGLNERFRFYRYDPGQKFALHHDGSYRRANGEESLLTFMIYLNQGFAGGETRFYVGTRHPLYLKKTDNLNVPCPYDDDNSEISVVPVTGMALCFIHDLPHEGASVLQGRKYVLRSDVMYSDRTPSSN